MAALPEIYLVRHGETVWTISGQFTGRVDLPLTPQGEHMARRLRAKLDGIEFTQVLASPLRRARVTCEKAGFGDRVELDQDLAEWDYGAYEGKSLDEIRRERPEWSLFRDGCPKGESVEEVSRRADRVAARLRETSGRSLVFGHGHFLRMLGARWIDHPPATGACLLFATAAVSILGYEHTLDRPAFVRWNDAQLPEAA